ncbi:uncharacterized protein PRCAT00006403001 [Priceomyces carsonii]|uniref:uncharacterized protein n=1 Tax=Priceomyces carsonii TaxID=28549 RepID=UPI002ED89B09|nr:unnamed protein product [Priceomyces carsonii]
MITRCDNCIHSRLSEIAIAVKMPYSHRLTKRPYAALLYLYSDSNIIYFSILGYIY